MPLAAGPSEFRSGPENDPFATAVGKFMLNCGSLEWVTIAWVDALTAEPVLLDRAVQMQMARRLDLLESLIVARQLDPKVGSLLRDLISEARSLNELRNRVAHGPLALGWEGTERTGPPDYLGIPDFRSLKSHKAANQSIVSLEGLERAVSEAAHCVSRLQALRLTFQGR